MIELLQISPKVDKTLLFTGFRSCKSATVEVPGMFNTPKMTCHCSLQAEVQGKKQQVSFQG